MRSSSWQAYHLEYKKQLALGNTAAPLDYGSVIYMSPVIAECTEVIAQSPANNVSHNTASSSATTAINNAHKNTTSSNLRWLVVHFEREFNVFCEQMRSGRSSKKFMASFSSKEAAQRFALEMLLTCAGMITRKG